MTNPILAGLLTGIGVPVDAGEPVFEAPWQASAFALTLSVFRADQFTWNEWVEVLSAAIKDSPQRQNETIGYAYYRQWLAALERLTIEHGILDSAELTHECGRWREAYAATPHGQPVVLAQKLTT